MKPLNQKHFIPDQSGNGNHFYSEKLISLLKEAKSVKVGDPATGCFRSLSFSRVLSNEEVAVVEEYMDAEADIRNYLEASPNIPSLDDSEEPVTVAISFKGEEVERFIF